MSYNRVVLMGHLTRDPELVYAPSGSAIAKWSLADNRKWKTQDGVEHEEVSFFDCLAFGTLGETICRLFRKGGQVLVEGRLRQNTWEDRQTGVKRSKLEIVVERFAFAGASGTDKASAAQASEAAPPRSPARAPASAPSAALTPDDEDDVPF